MTALVCASCALAWPTRAAARERLALRTDTGDTLCEPGALQHAAALVAVRENRLSEALPLLDALRARCPATPAFLFDHIAVSSWSGHYAAAWTEGQDIAAQPKTPAYVVESVAVAARESGHYDAALTIYDALLAREPDRVQAQPAGP
jgi:predicted Zn-dependent protease